jgi:hypothetical protein
VIGEEKEMKRLKTWIVDVNAGPFGYPVMFGSLQINCVHDV